MFKQPDDGATSLDSELHLDPDSQQPIIPRHARDQLKTEDITEEVKTEEVLVQEKAPIKKRPTHSLVELQQAILEKEQQAAEQEKAEQEKAEQAKIVTSQQMVTERRTPSTEQVAKEIAQTPSIQPQVDTVVTETISDTAVQQDVILQESIQSENSKQESSQRNTLNQDVSSRDVLNQDVLNPDILNQDISISEIDDFEGESSILDLHLNEQQRYDDESVLANAENIIALNVYPNIRFALSGDKTLKILLKYGLRYGEMACFHRYEQIDEPSQLMFSVLRITDEGHAGFDLETLSTEQVQGLAFFLALPHNDVQKGYDTMVSIAGLIAREIDGTVYDENNLEFTPQLKEHWRHQAIDYRSAQEA